MSKYDFDVIILGGGLVGLTAALLCAKQGFSVGVVEKNAPDLTWDLDQFDLRCSAISRKSQRIFEKIGVWGSIVTQRVSPYRTMVVWDALSFSEIIFNAVEVGEPDLGHIIENRVIIKALWESVEQHPNITLKFATRPKTLQIDAKSVRLETQDQDLLQAKLIIGADGAQSWLRNMANIVVTERDYHQHALVATVKTELPHQETAWQRFLPEGPLAFLPLTGSCMSSIVWTATEEKIRTLMLLSEKQFCEALAHAFDYRLGQILSSSEYQQFPLKKLHAKQYVKDRIVLIGDALHVIHPLAGQGVNLGLSDALELVQVITAARMAAVDIGNYLILRKFERSRKGVVAGMILAMDFFKKTFGSRLSGVAGLRSFGLDFVNQSSYLKRKIIQAALGMETLGI
jgi:2-octaprenylphenol hydroxylase